MELSSDQRAKLFSFLGYGNPAGSFWFLGMEEAAAGSDESLKRNINVRLQFKDGVMDLKEAHVKERINYLYWEGKPGRKLPSTWVWMAKFVRGLVDNETNADHWLTDTQAAKEFVRNHLGRSHSNTFLVDLLPLPKASANRWPSVFENWFGFKSMDEYKQALLPQRIALLKNAIERYRPKYLFAYGNYSRGRYRHYEEVVSGTEWKATPLPNTRIHVGVLSSSTRVIFAPFLGTGQLSGDEARRLQAYLRQMDQQ
jgi:hypothetical protein